MQAAKNGIPVEEVIVDILNQKWDHERTKFSLPPLMTLVSIRILPLKNDFGRHFYIYRFKKLCLEAILCAKEMKLY